VQVSATDPDSTPDQDNILLVSASYTDPTTGGEISLVLLDDASQYLFSTNQIAAFPEACTDDPVSGVCECKPATYTLTSGDLQVYDTIFTRNFSFVSSAADPLLADCIHRAAQLPTLQVPAGSPLNFLIEAVDRQGNLTAWPQLPSVTTGVESLRCSGDPCGCCLLAPAQPAGCSGLPGMTSPSYPDGYCRSLP
jgi:hypothetical protein